MKNHYFYFIAPLIGVMTCPYTYASYDSYPNVIKEIDAAYTRLMPVSSNVLAVGTQGIGVWQTMLDKVTAYINTLTDPHKATLITISKPNMDLFKRAQTQVENLSNALINAIKLIPNIQLVAITDDPNAVAQNSKQLAARKKILEQLLETKKTSNIEPLKTELKKKGTLEKKETRTIKDIYIHLLSKLSEGISKVNMDFSKLSPHAPATPPAVAPQEPATPWTARYKSETEALKALNNAYAKMIPASQNIFKIEYKTWKMSADAWKNTVTDAVAYIKAVLEKERVQKKSAADGIPQNDLNLFNDAQKVIKIFSDDVVETIIKLANTKVRDVEWESDLKALSTKTRELAELQKKLTPIAADNAVSKKIKNIYILLASLLQKAIPKISNDYMAYIAKPAPAPVETEALWWKKKYTKNDDAVKAIDKAYDLLITQNIKNNILTPDETQKIRKQAQGTAEWNSVIKNIIAYIKKLSDPKKSISQPNMEIFTAALAELESPTKEAQEKTASEVYFKATSEQLIDTIKNVPPLMTSKTVAGTGTHQQKIKNLETIRDDLARKIRAATSNITDLKQKLAEISDSKANTANIKKLLIHVLSKLEQGINTMIITLNKNIETLKAQTAPQPVDPSLKVVQPKTTKKQRPLSVK